MISFAASEKTIEEQIWAILPFEVPMWAQILVEVLVQVVLTIASMGTILVALPGKIAEASAKISLAAIIAAVKAFFSSLRSALTQVGKIVVFLVTAVVATTATSVATGVAKGIQAGLKTAITMIKSVVEIIVDALIQSVKVAWKMIKQLLTALYSLTIKGTVQNAQANWKFLKILVGAYTQSAKESVKAHGIVGAIGKGASSATKAAGRAVGSAASSVADSFHSAKNFLSSREAISQAVQAKAKAAKQSMWSKLFTETSEGGLQVNNATQKELAGLAGASAIMYSTTSLTVNDRLQTAIIEVGVAFGIPEEIMDMLAQQIVAMIQILALFAAIFTLAGAGVSIQLMYKTVLVFQSASQGMSSIFQGVSLIRQGQAQEKIGEEQKEAERYKGLVMQTKILEKDFQVGIDKMQETYDQLATDFKAWGDTLEHMFNAYKSAVNNMTMRA